MLTTILTTSIALLGLGSVSSAAYTLQDDYNPSTFFSMFNFYTGADPTAGYVTFLDQSTAQSQGLISTTSSTIYMGVDYTNIASGSGRSSVRIESKKQYTHGLFILDLNHMPGSICGVWPAFWSYGPNWPNSGEIDIIEGVNSQSTNFMTLHTGTTCSMSKSNSSGYTGTQFGTDCNVNTGGGGGCAVHDTKASSYGTGLNNAKGGVYATEWTSSAIKIWWFPRGSIPSDITSGSPNPANWGTPDASFNGGGNCNIDAAFMNNWLVFDTTFCGAWAGSADVWAADTTCAPKAATCNDYVQNNPSAFKEAYWSLNGLKVYQNSGSSKRSSTTTVATATTAALRDSTSVAATTTSTTPKRDSLPHRYAGRQPKDASAVTASGSSTATSAPFKGLSPNDNGHQAWNQGQHSNFLVPGIRGAMNAGRHRA